MVWLTFCHISSKTIRRSICFFSLCGSFCTWKPWVWQCCKIYLNLTRNLILIHRSMQLNQHYNLPSTSPLFSLHFCSLRLFYCIYFQSCNIMSTHKCVKMNIQTVSRRVSIQMYQRNIRKRECEWMLVSIHCYYAIFKRWFNKMSSTWRQSSCSKTIIPLQKKRAQPDDVTKRAPV